MYRQQIRLRKIAIVVRFLFGAHRGRCRASRSFQSRVSCGTRAAAFDHADLALDFKLNRFLHETERIQIFDFDLGAELLGAARADADVGVAAERAFLHVAITDPGVEQDLAERT